MLRKNCFLYLVLLSFLTGACTTQKKLAYFKSVTSESAGQINDEFQTAHEARIVAGANNHSYRIGPNSCCTIQHAGYFIF